MPPDRGIPSASWEVCKEAMSASVIFNAAPHRAVVVCDAEGDFNLGIIGPDGRAVAQVCYYETIGSLSSDVRAANDWMGAVSRSVDTADLRGDAAPLAPFADMLACRRYRIVADTDLVSASNPYGVALPGPRYACAERFRRAVEQARR